MTGRAGKPIIVGGRRTSNRFQRLPTTQIRIVRQLFDIAVEAGLGPAEIGRRVGVSTVTASRWKHGYADPSAYHAEKLAAALGYELELRKADGGRDGILG